MRLPLVVVLRSRRAEPRRTARAGLEPSLNLAALPVPEDDRKPIPLDPSITVRGVTRVDADFGCTGIEQGHFTWKEWVNTLADELKAATDRGEPDDGSRYYYYWLAALERLVTSKGLLDRDALETRKEAWAEAYEHTPHGQPVELAAGSVAQRDSNRPFVRSLLHRS